MAKLTKAQDRMLRRLGEVADGNAFQCGGHQAGACAKLVEKGLAEFLGLSRGNKFDPTHRAFRITEAGRAALTKDTQP